MNELVGKLLRAAAVWMILLMTACAGSPEPTGQAPAPAGEVFSWLRVATPEGWRETGPGVYEGPDGYARLELLDSGGASINALCMTEANRDEAFGDQPEIVDRATGDLPGCLILPSAGQPGERRGEALYLLDLPESIQPGGVLALRADKEHITGLAEGLAVNAPAAPNGACDFSIAGSPSQVTEMGAFQVDEFALAKGAGCSPLADPSGFYERVQSGRVAERVAWLQDRMWRSDRLARVNDPLERFGYKVQTEIRMEMQRYQLLRQGEPLRSNLSWLGQVTVRADGQDLIFPVLDSYNAASYVIRKDGQHPAETADLLVYDLVFPIYVGNDEIRLAYDYEVYPRPSASPALVRVLRNEQEIARYSVSGATPAGGPVRGLWAYDGHWVVELPGVVIQDGEILNETLGYSEMFTWRLLRGAPFFFYRQDGVIHASYDGQTLPVTYDEVIYGPQWSGRMLAQMKVYEAGLFFYARKGDTWYAVVYEVE